MPVIVFVFPVLALSPVFQLSSSFPAFYIVPSFLGVIYNVVFHPDTLRLATKSDKFLAIVNLTTLETVSQNFGVDLDTCNVSTLDVTYKGHPHAGVLRKPSTEVTPKLQDPSDPLCFPYPYDALGGQKKSGHNNQDRTLKIQPALRERRPSQEPTVPHYTIGHRSYVDIQDYRYARDSAPSPVPEELVTTVDLPLLCSASEVDLHIEGKALSLEYKKPVYKLQIKLPYLVADDQGMAEQQYRRQEDWSSTGRQETKPESETRKLSPASEQR